MVTVKSVARSSQCARHGIKAGYHLVSVNGHEVNDVLDYRFYTCSEKPVLLFTDEKNKKHKVKLKKEEYDDPGLSFETYLMDAQHSCCNKCIFCFVDQLPPHMRSSLYFKDDDERLSFFFGNYITLTNLSEHDIQRIINMHISPVNISVHTMEPDLRVEMMKNPHAGECLSVLRRLADAGTKINAQLVLCPGINDGEHLSYSLEKLAELYPSVCSIACVPVGLTDHRSGLYELQPYTKQTAGDTIDLIENFGNEFFKAHGTRLAYPADEFYLKAGRPMPDASFYEEYDQLDNGVGMWRLFHDDFFSMIKREHPVKTDIKKVTLVTGKASEELMQQCADELSERFKINVCVSAIINERFGHMITVSGLVTGGDIISQLKGRDNGQLILIPSCMLKSTYPHDESTKDGVFLDDLTVPDVSEALGVRTETTPCDAGGFIDRFMEVISCQNR